MITATFSPWTEGNAWNSTIPTVMREALTAFEHDHPKVQVKPVPGRDRPEQIWQSQATIRVRAEGNQQPWSRGQR